MKNLVITDTHLGLNGDSDVWLEIVYNFFQDIKKFCEENEIKRIFHLGDFFHNRKSTNTKTLDYGHKIAALLDKFNVYMIVGNHDCYFKNSIHPTSLSMFKKYHNIEIIDEPRLLDGILLIPWGSGLPETECKYCFGHFAINGFHMNDSYICRDGVEKRTFDNFDVVLSGHFHTPSKQGNIVYLGSPYAQTFHDAGSSRGFYTFENEDGTLTYYEYKNAPKFVKMKTDNIDDSLIEGNVVKLIFTEDYGTNKNQRIVDGVLKNNPLSFSIDFTNVSDEGIEPEDEVAMENREELVKAYLAKANLPSNIDKKILQSMFFKMMKEVDR
jgi:DNA repair exonuclease SbcCD nuclease subunit